MSTGVYFTRLESGVESTDVTHHIFIDVVQIGFVEQSPTTDKHVAYITKGPIPKKVLSAWSFQSLQKKVKDYVNPHLAADMDRP